MYFLRQALISKYFPYYARDFDTLNVTCLFVSKKNILDFDVCGLKNYADLPLKCPHQFKSHVAVGDVANIFTSCALPHPGNA